MTTRRVLPALVLALLLAGCGGGFQQAGGGGGSATTAPPTSAAGTRPPPASSGAPHDDGEHLPPFPADTNPDTGQASPGARGTVTAVTIGHHEGFDRVVFEFQGTGTPGWTVRYVPAATSQGRGEPIDLPGSAVLSVALTGVGYPTETGIRECPRGAVTGHDTDVVTQAYFDGTFEGISQAFVGTAATRPFRVYLLTGPARVVLDVREH